MIFYSGKHDELSMVILNMLNRSGLLSYFLPIDIDGRLELLEQNGLTGVPVMIVKDIPKPMYGKDIIGWIRNMKFMRENNQKKLVAANMMKTMMQQQKNKDNLPGFNEMEMGNISDSFSFHDENIIKLLEKGKMGEALQQSFFEVGSEKGNGIFTAPELGKMNKNAQDKKIRDMKKSREEQDSDFGHKMKEDQLNAVLQAEQEKDMHKNTMQDQSNNKQMSPDQMAIMMQRMQQMQMQNQMQQQNQMQKMQQMQQMMNNSQGHINQGGNRGY